jgi:hypothetical protein
MGRPRACEVCSRPARWGAGGAPGWLCQRCALTWRDSAARLEVLRFFREWARVRAALRALRASP